MRGKGEGSVFKDSRGLWTAVIELPARNGKRRRKTIRSKDKKTALAKLREAQRELARAGDLETRPMTVEAWMNEWFASIATPKIRPRTAKTYRSLIDREIIPTIGATKLDKLTPDQVRQMNNGIITKGLSSTTALQVHRILAVALKYAEREGKVTRNVATLIDAPKKVTRELQALDLDEGLRVIESVSTDPLGSLWAAVLLTGAREGELLGLQIDRVREVAALGQLHKVLDFSWQLQRFIWDHGCAGRIGVDQNGRSTFECGRFRGSDCPRRKVNVPADHESRNLVGGLWLSRPKSKKGRRVIPLVEPLASIITNHIASNGHLPNPHNLVWRREDGSPIDPRDGNRMWHDVLERAGVKQVRFHDGRHTTVDLLLLAGVPIEVVQEIVGHSSRAQTEEYRTRALTLRHVQAMNSLSDLIDARRAERPQIGS